jgi:hypothetical protein
LRIQVFKSRVSAENSYQAFGKIGDDWDSDVFSEARFHEIKNWAIARYEAENSK